MERKSILEIFRCGKYTMRSLFTLFVLSVAFGTTLMAQQVNRKITVRVSNVEVRQAIDALQKASGFHFVYEEKSLPTGKRVTLAYQEQPFTTVLSDFCQQTSLNYEVKRNLILLSPSKGKATSPKKRTLTGVVMDEEGEPLPGANLFIRQTQTGTMTDVDGKFSLMVNDGEVIDFSFIGMDGKQVKVTSAMKNLKVTLEASATALQDVVVTGYQTLSKERAAGSFATVTAKDLDSKLDTDLASRLEGSVAGMTSYRNNVTIRGISTLSGEKNPLYVVDGVPYEGSIAAINPAEITNVTVLKDAAAASIYGARSSNGVIVITTRGGGEGPTKVHYNGSIKFTPLYDVDYLNLMSSSEFIDFQQKMFNLFPGGNLDGTAYYQDPVRTILWNHKNGKLTDAQMEEQLNVYRNRDREEQVKKYFMRLPAIKHQHNLSISGGTKNYNYALSLNYLKDLPYDKFSENDRMGFNLKNSWKPVKWMRADLRVLGSIYRSDAKTGHSGSGYLTGKSTPSYILYRDEEGNDMPWFVDYKSQKEIDRLIGVGLLDQTYYPLQDVNREHQKSRDYFLNLNANLNFFITKDLTFNLIISKDFGNSYNKKIYDKDSRFVRNDVNNAAQIVDGKIIYNIPEGGQLIETRSDNEAYTLRAQANYNKVFNDKHQLTVLAGAERRANKYKATSVKKVGYDDQMLSYKPIDVLTLSKGLRGTQAIGGRYNYSNSDGFSANEDRYVSFYGNASYTFNERATLSGSIRIDQSNLFGSDPKYQYRPLWSLGGQYTILKNHDWVDRLSARTTIGINGNIPKTNGPFLTVSNGGVNQWTGEYSSIISNPDNQGLRWEKTTVFNIGVDYNLFKNRVSGSVEFYNRSTTDLLHTKSIDPTLGWTVLNINYGSMYNRGVEFTLRTLNFSNKNFSWHSTFNFSYNKNKITELENTNTDAIKYISGGQNRVGDAMNTLYSLRWAGLDEKGDPQAYKKDGTIVQTFNDIDKEDLVKSGTITPPYAASFMNDFRYKDFTLSLLFTYYGGHVMRGEFAEILRGSAFIGNRDRLDGHFWTKPGDENDPSMAPAFRPGIKAWRDNLWYAADKHVQRGDYIKLNNIILGYNLPKSLLRKTFLKGAKVMVQIDNVGKWVANDQGLDPETWTGASLNPSRGQKNPTTYTLGVSCNF